MNSISLKKQRLASADVAVFILFFTTALFAWIAPNGNEVFQYRIQTTIFIIGFFLLPAVLGSHWAIIRPYIYGLAIFSLYGVCGKLGLLIAKGRSIDSVLRNIDLLMLGRDPALLPDIPSMIIEYLAFSYAFFIPYIHLSLFLNFVGRSAAKREQFLCGFCLLYLLSFFGYLFFPARGPGAFADQYGYQPLHGGYFLQLVQDAVKKTGGYLGAFPSLHMGASFYFVLADRERDRLRSLLFIPLLLSIIVSTIVLRYHYVIDLPAGVICALFALSLSKQLVREES